MRPRVLVVRSGSRSVLEDGVPAGIDLVERVSHRVEPVTAADAAPPEPPDLVVFTSRIAVAHALGERAPGSLRERLAGARLAAVGPATAEALRAEGRDPGIVAAGSSAALLEALPSAMAGVRVLWPCGEDADAALERELVRRGARVERRVVYRKVPAPADAALGREILDRPFAAFAATSPAAVRWLWDVLGDAERARLRDTPVVALGPSTRAALAERGMSHIETTAEASFAEALRMLAALAAGAAAQ
jgi:uroporphyrinogen-III synthase